MADTDNSSPILRYNLVTNGVEYFQGSDFYPIAVASPSGVSSLNTLTGAVTLSAGSNITLTPSGNTITIASTGGGGGISQTYNTYTPTFSGVTPLTSSFTYVTTGTEVTVRGYFTADSVTSTTFSISVPVVMNTAHLPSTTAALGEINGAADSRPATLFFDGSTNTTVFLWAANSAGSPTPLKANADFFDEADGVSVNFTYPI